MKLDNVKEFDTDYGPARRGTNDKGEAIIVRHSREGSPTIERQVNGKKKSEIRYDD